MTQPPEPPSRRRWAGWSVPARGQAAWNRLRPSVFSRSTSEHPTAPPNTPGVSAAPSPPDEVPVTPGLSTAAPLFAPEAWGGRLRRAVPAHLPRSVPLPLTSSVLVLLILLPALQLIRMPRPRAVGLEQLLGEASLLQSFPPTPDRPVPPLWKERLGAAQAESLWRRQRGPWWQFWGDHADAAPLLAFSASSLAGGPSAPVPANGLRVGDLVVVAADPLSRQLLRDRLLPQQRLSRGLNRRCLERLRQDQAVLWNGTGLGVIAGPLAPLLQRFARGCQSFRIEAGTLVWQGEAGGGDGLLLPLAPSRTSRIPELAPLPAGRLLEVEGGSVSLLFDDLLARPLIRDPLISVYGLGESRLSLLHRTPFRLRLLPLAQGPFQASLELQLAVRARDRRAWDSLLSQLSRSLVQRGLSPSRAAGSTGASGAGPTPPAPPPQSKADPAAATWTRDDGVIVGGWRWLEGSGREPQLLFFIGPVPAEPHLAISGGAASLPGPGQLRLRSRPQALQALGLLPPQVPELVRRADQLWMVAVPPPGGNPGVDLSLLSGGLRVSR